MIFFIFSEDNKISRNSEPQSFVPNYSINENHCDESEDEFYELDSEKKAMTLNVNSKNVQNISSETSTLSKTATAQVLSDPAILNSAQLKRVANSSINFTTLQENSEYHGTFPPSRPSTFTSKTESQKISLDSLGGQLSFHSSKSIEKKERVTKRSRSVETLRNQISELQKSLRLKDVELDEKNKRNKLIGQNLNQQREKIKKLQQQVENQKKTKNELKENLKVKDEKMFNLESQNQNFKQKLKLMMMSNETLVSELKLLSPSVSKYQFNQDDLDQKFKNLEIELNSRDLKIDILNLELDQVNEENVRIVFRTYFEPTKYILYDAEEKGP